MSETQMRSVIRLLSDSPLVDRITLNPTDNQIYVFYNSHQKNADYIENIVGIVNFYFDKLYNIKNTLVLKKTDEQKTSSSKKKYYLNTYSSKKIELYRLDMQGKYENSIEYNKHSKELADIEISCLITGRKFIVSELGKRGSPKTCVVELNYANLKHEETRMYYTSCLKEFPEKIRKNIELSIIRVNFEDCDDDITKIVKNFSKFVNTAYVSVYYDQNPEQIKRISNLNLKKFILTIDCEDFQDQNDVLKMQKNLKSYSRENDILLIRRNQADGYDYVDEPGFHMLSYMGRQSIES